MIAFSVIVGIIVGIFTFLIRMEKRIRIESDQILHEQIKDLSQELEQYKRILEHHILKEQKGENTDGNDD